MSGYAAWLAWLVKLGRVDAGGVRLRRRCGMITQSEYNALERLAAECPRGACLCARCAGRACERGRGC